jgi:heparanase
MCALEGKRCFGLLPFLATALAVVGSSTCLASDSRRSSGLAPATMARIGTVDERFQSYNIEMIEVTGGRFWKPYSASGKPASAPAGDVPAGMDPSMYEYRPPLNLANPRLRALAAALGPAYVRVSGTWANSTYFHDSDTPPPGNAPEGFGGVLTRQQWKSVVDFSRAVDAKIVTSFATSPGTRDARDVWTPAEARKVLSYTKSSGGSIAAAEFMNEPTYAEMGGAPKGYDAAAYGRDIAVFRPFAKTAAPDMVVLGPGGVGEGIPLMPIGLAGSVVNTEDILKATGPVFDAFSYHSYGATSKRCAAMGPASQTTAEAALSETFLSRADTIEAFYAGLRDRFEPGRPIWLTETADAACGGNPWAPTFLDSFRYLDQLGRLAKRGVNVHMHNTLASSDYGLLDGNTLAPRPNYWAALLWRRLMGTIVLDAGPPHEGLHLYAQCLRGHPGGIALLAINNSRKDRSEITLPVASVRYTLSASALRSTSVMLNGESLKLASNDDLPKINGRATAAGPMHFAPATITFLAVPEAGNAACAAVKG